MSGLESLMKKIAAALLMVTALVACPLAQSQTAADIVGTWDVMTSSPVGDTTNAMVVSQDGDKLKAVAKGDAGELPYDRIEIAGANVTFVLTIDYQGSPMTITYTGVVDDKKMGGDCDFGGLAQGTWSAARK